MFPNSPIAGTNATGSSQRHLTADLYTYAQAVMADAAQSSRVRIVEKDIGATVLGRRLKYYAIGTPDNIANLDAGRNDGAFWSGVVSGEVPASEGLAAVRTRPAFAWITATPHGSEPAAGEAISRQLYELAARTDCANLQRLSNLTLFLDPARNPDGRDVTNRYTAWGFDPNRDFGTRNQPENRNFMPEINKYPGLFFIDAHQNTGSYFFPPNEDPVHHEISQFALDFIQYRIGPAIQSAMNDQSISYRNYNTYDLFTPEYGDTVPALLMGSAGMTFEQPTGDAYGKQIYNHYLAIDTTINVTSRDKVNLLTAWVKQWQEAVDQGARCELQPNKLVSPLHTEITQQPSGSVCGYYYKPGLHSGDTAKLMRDLISSEVNVYRLDQPVTVTDGVHEFGPAGSTTDTLPAGTLFIPMAQPQKHWIQAILGEDPFIPFPYFYDVVTWSYSLMRGMAGNGFVTKNLPSGTAMTKISDPVAARRARRGEPGVRVQHGLDAGHRPGDRPGERGRDGLPRHRGVRLRRPPLRHGRRPGRRGDDLARRPGAEGARPRHAGLRPAALRRPAQGDREAEDRHVDRQRQHRQQPGVRHALHVGLRLLLGALHARAEGPHPA